MMLVAFVALGDPPDFPEPPEPSPGILSLTAEAAPFSAPLTGLSPSAADLPAPSTDFIGELPLATSSRRSVRPVTRSPTALSALLPKAETRSFDADLRRFCPELFVAMPDY